MAAFVFAALFVVFPGPAIAGPDARRVGEDSVSVTDARSSQPSSKQEPSPRKMAGSQGPWYKYKARVVRDGQWCMQTRWTRDADRARFAPVAADAYNILTPPPPDCPAAERNAVSRAEEFWDVRVLPSPTLRARPGWAITGKPVYLEIVGDRERTFEVDNPIGADVAIEATSEYVVDWGDGAVTRTTSPGGPWPHGDVIHTYTDVGNVTITVTQRWRATWEAGDDGGSLGELVTRARLDDFRVVQLQAVRRR